MQLELLDWALTGATLICFPQDRNIGKARHVAETYLRRRTDRAREAYWTDTCETLAGVMKRRGFDESEIERQILAFRRVVQAEIARLQRDTCRTAGTF